MFVVHRATLAAGSRKSYVPITPFGRSFGPFARQRSRYFARLAGPWESNQIRYSEVEAVIYKI
jgi:hypothetical protein